MFGISLPNPLDIGGDEEPEVLSVPQADVPQLPPTDPPGAQLDGNGASLTNAMQYCYDHGTGRDSRAAPDNCLYSRHCSHV